MPAAPISALLQGAVSLHQQGQLAAALAAYREVLALDAQQVDALHLSGVIARQQGDAHGAVLLIERSLALQPAQARAHCNLGAAYADLQQPQQALASYERALKLDPRYALAHSNRGNALRALGRLNEAIASYEQALRLQATSETACQRAIALHDLGRFQQALDGAEHALRLRANHVDAWLARGNALYALGRYQDALDSFTRAGALGGERADLAAWRGGAEVKLGRLADAVASFDASLALRPAHPATTLRRAHALAALGDTATAGDAYASALALGADGEEIGYALAALGLAPVPAAAPASYVAALFDQYADHFDAHLVEQLDYRTPELIASALARTDSGARDLVTLDLGCGTGLCGALLRPLSARLVGVDLSAAMLARARARGLYDELLAADIVAFLTSAAPCDLIVAADVLVYLGALDGLLAGARHALRPGGRLCFSIELIDDGDFVLQPSRRYAHSEAYVHRLAAQYDLQVIDACDGVLRREGALAIAGKVLVLQREGGDQRSARCS